MFTPGPVTLQRGALRLEPLVDADIPALVELAEHNRDELIYLNGPLRPDWYRLAVTEQRQGRAVVFTGSIKHLLLKHAFEDWHLVRLQLKTAASNMRSQRAIEKLGAQREGLLRNHRRLADGRLDDTVLYSITDREWPAVKRLLEPATR